MMDIKSAHSNGELERGKASALDVGEAKIAHLDCTAEFAQLQSRLALSAAEVAQLLGVGRHTMYTLCHREDFPAVRVGARIIIPVDALRRWLVAQEGGGDIV